MLARLKSQFFQTRAMFTTFSRKVDECGRRDLNPGRQLGKLMSYQTRLRPRCASSSMAMYGFVEVWGLVNLTFFLLLILALFGQSKICWVELGREPHCLPPAILRGKGKFGLSCLILPVTKKEVYWGVKMGFEGIILRIYLCLFFVSPRFAVKYEEPS